MQATSDIFLGWLRAQPTGGRDEDYYLRQLRDWKLSAEIEQMGPRSMDFVCPAVWLDARPRPRRRPNRHLGVRRRVDQV